MEEQLTILSDPPLNASQDFHFLREAGLEYIEALGHEFWTDYNLHDPGITILEALCYAITDLGHRTDFPVKDLITKVEGQPNPDLFSARTILHTCPLTENDYRKLLIDIKGINNAWLETDKKTGQAEQAIYVDCKNKSLTYTSQDHEQVRLDGLYYHVFLEFLPHDDFGDLNDEKLIFDANINGENYKLSVRFPKWNSLEPEFLCSSEEGAFSLGQISTDGLIKVDNNTWKTNLTAHFTLNSTTSQQDLPGVIIQILKTSKTLGLDEGTFKDELEEVLKKTGNNSWISRYRQKMIVVQNLIDEVWAKLQENRNLCEDFLAVDTIDIEDVGFCADVEIEPTADVEEVLAKIYFVIQQYLQPGLKFYSISELVELGKTTAEIFDGPRLNHGFILTNELEKTDLREKVYVSDLINLIMDIDGVVNLRDTLLSKYDSKGKEMVTNEKWILPITKNHRPRLSIERSRVRFFKSDLPFLARDKEMRETLKLLHATADRQKQRGGTMDYPVPVGRLLNLEDFTSVQHEFPSFYGLGYNKLLDSTPEERKARVRQLKAYLLFFDQILGNYLAQLKHVGSLFSFHEDIVQTYYAQFINDFDDAEHIYGDAQLLEVATRGPGLNENPSWRRLFEARETFFDRRNRFLDHLLARFGEQFSDYALMVYYSGGQKKEVLELIKDKMSFLQEYPEISSGRSRAFNYKDEEELWDTSNVAGLVKRVARLSGIDNYRRRDPFAVIIEVYGNYKFRIWRKEDNELLLSSIHNKTFNSSEEAHKTALTALRRAAQLNHYDQVESAQKFGFKILDAENNPIAYRYLNTEQERASTISELMELSQEESLLLIEHILLRPKQPGDKLMSICLEHGCQDLCGEQDPYSFRLTLVLPYWPTRFNNLAFRSFFERMVHLETPAHIIPKICWVDEVQLYTLQEAYLAWLNENAKPIHEQDSAQLIVGLDNLITALEALRSVFPPAILHDCDEGGEESSPVFLNQTSLGATNKSTDDNDIP